MKTLNMKALFLSIIMALSTFAPCVAGLADIKKSVVAFGQAVTKKENWEKAGAEVKKYWAANNANKGILIGASALAIGTPVLLFTVYKKRKAAAKAETAKAETEKSA